jgi:hypothetical protein
MTRPHYQEIADAIAQSERPSVGAAALTQATNRRQLASAVASIPPRDLAGLIIAAIRARKGQGEVDRFMEDAKREAGL